MMTTSSHAGTGLLGLVAATIGWIGCVDRAEAQQLGAQVTRAPDGIVTFHYAARDGVCGDGATTIRVGTSSYIQTSGLPFDENAPCQPGPVRVELRKADGQILAIRTVVGPLATLTGTDLGAVPVDAAATYLLQLAATLDGRPGRDAILPAALADSVAISSRLVTLARNGALSRQVRSSAVSWAVRSATPAEARATVPALVQLARDPAEAVWMREQALTALGRLDDVGVPVLLDLQRAEDPWLRQMALRALARTDDPRGRRALREVVRRGDAGEAELVEAIRGMGGPWATGDDLALLRERYPSFTGNAPREAVLAAMGAAGGRQNADWLFGVASRESEESTLRARALREGAQAGGSTTAIGDLYQRATDRRVREAALNELVRRGTPEAVDRLLAIARAETDARMRRTVIQRLGRMNDPKVKQYLESVITP